jgi:hypothetical protein
VDRKIVQRSKRSVTLREVLGFNDSFAHGRLQGSGL